MQVLFGRRGGGFIFLSTNGKAQGALLLFLLSLGGGGDRHGALCTGFTLVTVKVGLENQRKKEKTKRKWKHMFSFWTTNLLCPHFGLQTFVAKKNSPLFHMSVHLNK